MRSDLTKGKQILLDCGPICQDAHELENPKKRPQAAAGVGASFTPAEGSKRGRPHAHTRRSETRTTAAGWRERSESDEGAATGEDAGGRSQRQRRERLPRSDDVAKNEPLRNDRQPSERGTNGQRASDGATPARSEARTKEKQEA